MSEAECGCCFRRHALFTFAGGGQLVIEGTDGRAWFPCVQESERYSVVWMNYFDPAMGFQEVDPQTCHVTVSLAVRLNVSDEAWDPPLMTKEEW